LNCDDYAFSGCRELKAVSAKRVVKLSKMALVGSSVETLSGGEWPASGREVLKDMAVAAGPWVPVVWQPDAPLEVATLTSLSMQGGSLVVADGQGRLPVELDLSALDRLPSGRTLERAFALKSVRFSRMLVEIPERFLANCGQLVEVNSGECDSLRTIGIGAFEGCWLLREMVIPRGCQQINMGSSGILELDLRGCDGAYVSVVACHLLRKLCLSERASFKLLGGCNPALSSLSLRWWPRGGDWSWMRSTRLSEVRLRSMKGSVLEDGVWTFGLSHAVVFAEVGSIGLREGRPALP
jgi:hypothetical protein